MTLPERQQDIEFWAAEYVGHTHNATPPRPGEIRVNAHLHPTIGDAVDALRPTVDPRDQKRLVQYRPQPSPTGKRSSGLARVLRYWDYVHPADLPTINHDPFVGLVESAGNVDLAWSGMGDVLTGRRLGMWSFERARAADFHTDHYVSPIIEADFNRGAAFFFWIDQDTGGVHSVLHGNKVAVSGDGVSAWLRARAAGIRKAPLLQLAIALRWIKVVRLHEVPGP